MIPGSTLQPKYTVIRQTLNITTGKSGCFFPTRNFITNSSTRPNRVSLFKQMNTCQENSVSLAMLLDVKELVPKCINIALPASIKYWQKHVLLEVVTRPIQRNQVSLILWLTERSHYTNLKRRVVNTVIGSMLLCLFLQLSNFFYEISKRRFLPGWIQLMCYRCKLLLARRNSYQGWVHERKTVLGPAEKYLKTLALVHPFFFS